MGCSEEIDRAPSGNRTESETRSRDFPWVPSTTNDPAAVPRDTPSAALDHARFDVLGPRVKLPWYFSFGRRSSVMFLLSKRTVARLDGKYSFALLSLTSVLEERIGRSPTTIVLSFNWNPQIKIGYVPRAIIFRRYIVFS